MHAGKGIFWAHIDFSVNYVNHIYDIKVILKIKISKEPGDFFVCNSRKRDMHVFAFTY